MDANVRLAGARGDVPVDQAHVVARQVRPDLCELGAAPEDARAEVARQQAVDATAIERSRARSSGSGIGPGPGRCGCASRRECRGVRSRRNRPPELERRRGDGREHRVEHMVGS